jgi:predicted enzyme related to lactoylglutathione lyase
MERDSYAPGTPSWVDLGSPDIEASVGFYSTLLGWEVAEAQPDAGGYRIAHLGGRTVAGIGPQQGPKSAWTTYIATDDTDGTVKAIEANGGRVMMPPMDVMDQGRMAIAMDPEGAAFGVWQAGAHKGAQVVNESGAVGWNELWTRNADQAKAFYRAVFGYTLDEESMPGYTVWQVDGQPVGGCMTMPPDLPDRVPAHWNVYFLVDDVDAKTEQVTALGGSVVSRPFDVPTVGRIAVVHGPAFESFALFAAAPQA